MTLLKELTSELGFSDVFTESIKDGLLITDTYGKIIIVNSSLCEITGFKKEELLESKAPFPFWPPDFYDEYESGFRQMLKEDLKGEFESVHLRRNGEHFPVSVLSQVLRMSGEKLLPIWGFYRLFLNPGVENYSMMPIIKTSFPYLSIKENMLII